MGSRREQSSVAARSMTWDLRFTSNNSNGICVLNVAGRVGAANAPDLEAALEDAARKARHRLVVELSGVDYLSSGGLTALAGTANRCRENGGALILVMVSDPVRITLELAGLLAQIPVEPSIEAAARALAT
jgi:anti-anti-sigma factor